MKGLESLYQENILNQYESYTYRWAVHMCHPMEAHEFDNLLDMNRVITLAESGVENEISIENVTQDLVLTFAQQNRNSVANQFTFNFLETSGATFFTRIYTAAKQLGIENHLQACYLLELKFTGWTESGQAVPIIIGPYYYMTTLTGLTMDHADGASKYAGSFIETMTDAYSRLEFHLTADIVVEASTYGQFLTEFQTRVQEQSDEQAKNGIGRVLPTIYEFKTDVSEWLEYEFDAVTGSRLQQYSGISVSGAGTLRFAFPAGTAITSATSLALYQTRNFKKLLTDAGFAKEDPDDGEADATQLADIVKWVKYNTQVEYIAYDFVLKHYQKKITYTSGAYLTPEVVHDPNSYTKLVRSSALQSKRLQNIFDKGLLRKRFDYIHTGLNTEVTDLDIQLNNVYYQIQAINSGALQHRENSFNSSASDAQFEIAQLRGDRNSLRSRISSMRSNMDSNQAKIEELGSKITGPDSAIRLGDDIKALEAENNELSLQIRELAPQRTFAEQVYDQRYNEFNQEQKGNTDNRLDLPSLAQRYITQSDLYSEKDLTDLLPLNFRYAPVDSLPTMGPDKGQDDVGTVMLGAVEMNLNSLADLVEQTLHIRGDPYWLGRPRGNYNNNTQADYDRGGLQYFLNLNFPTYPDEQTGLMSAKQNFAVTGVYRVYQLQANYANGSFTMMLSSFRDMNTNVNTLYEELLFGNVFDRATRGTNNVTTGVNETENDGTDNSDAVPPNIPDTGAVENANGVDNAGGHTNLDSRTDSNLRQLLIDSANATGVTIDGTSGLRPGSSSGRHHGDAHDIALYSGGRRLSVGNPADRAIIQSFSQQFHDRATAQGYTPSIGWANHGYPTNKWYMSGNTGHFDIAVGKSIGANRGTFWGGSGETRDIPAPTWLRNMMT